MKNNTLPLKYKAAILPAYNPNLIRAIIGFRTEERKMPQLKADEVLIRIEAAPINPSDIAFIQGGYNVVKPLPAVPGFEGSGTVVQTGSDAKALLGKRVSCFTQDNGDGTWAEYIATNAKSCITLKDEISFEQAACMAINPFTAFGLFELCLKKKCKAFIQNAAGGQLAGFLRLIAKKAGIETINIVRKSEQLDFLKKKGEKYILNSTSKNFQTELNEIAHELNANIAFDAVGGDMTAAILQAMPTKSETVVYGGLSGKDISGINTLGIIFHNKKLSGFNLNEWIASKTISELQSISNEIQDIIISGAYQTTIQASFGLDEIVQGIRVYIKSMSDGKVLFKP